MPRREDTYVEQPPEYAQMAMLVAVRQGGARGWLRPGYTLRPYYVWWWKFCQN